VTAEEPIDSVNRILVTGASGFLGRRLVAALIEGGFEVRALIRTETQQALLGSLGAEPVLGDVSDRESLASAFTDVDFVVHAAADTSGSIEAGRLSTIKGTRNVLELCSRYQVGKLVYISSCSVYGIAERTVESRVDENSPLEPHPDKRGPYSCAKFEAEQLVLDYIEVGSTATVCLRPGTIYGPCGEPYTPMLGFSRRDKLFAVIGNGRFVLPLVYVDNLVDAIIASLLNKASDGQVYNVVDPERVDKELYMRNLIGKLYPEAKYFYFPYRLLFMIVLCQEMIFKILRGKPCLTRYRLISSQKSVVYDSGKIQRQLGWQQRVSFAEAICRIAECNQA
jgi:nucleoside-diphosphate-sugar epimerase